MSFIIYICYKAQHKQVGIVARETTLTTDPFPTIMTGTQSPHMFKIGIFGRSYFADLHISLGTCVMP